MAAESTAITQNEMNEINVLIKDLVSQAGFAQNVVLNDAQFEQVSAHMVNLLK